MASSADSSLGSAHTTSTAHALPRIVPLKDDVLRGMARQGLSLAEMNFHVHQSNEATKLLKTLDAERAQLPHLLDGVVEQRAPLQAYIRQINCLRSPISQLPDELISNIMLISVNDIFPPPVWTQAQVCTRWRNVALCTPTLWTRVNLQFPSNSEISLRVLREILRRSGNLPLSICAFTREREIEAVDRLTEEHAICDALADESQRWSEATFRIPAQIYYLALGRLGGKLPMLRSLNIDNSGSGWQVHTLDTVPTFFLGCDIQSLCLYNTTLDLGALESSQWKNVSELALDSTWEDSSQLLSLFGKSLVRLTITYPFGGYAYQPDSTIIMDKLESLKIDINGGYHTWRRNAAANARLWESLVRFLAALTCPKLHTLAIDPQVCNAILATSFNILSNEIFGMLESSRSGPLQTLHLSMAFAEPQLLVMLEKIPSLLILKLGSAEVGDTPDNLRPERYPRALLTALQQSESLLPNLQELRLYEASKSWFVHLVDMALDLLEHRYTSRSLSTVRLLELEVKTADVPLEAVLDEGRSERICAFRRNGVIMDLNIHRGPGYACLVCMRRRARTNDSGADRQKSGADF